MSKHPNSKIVRLKRNRPFVHEQINSEAVQYALSYTKRGLGSYWAPGSTMSGSGLTPVEEQTLLPLVIGVRASSDKFQEKRDEYYTEINTVIPHGELGLELEIGLTIDNNQPLSVNPDQPDKSNIPLNMKQYLAYRHAIGKRDENGKVQQGLSGHPFVAFSPEAALGDSTIQYYIEDPTKQEALKLSALDLKDKARAVYLQVVNEGMDKIKMVVTLMVPLLRAKPGQPKLDPETATDSQLKFALSELADSNPTKFIEYGTDDHLKQRYAVSRMISAGILIRMAGVLVDAETNQKLGDDIGQVAKYLADPANVAVKNKYKNLLDQSLK